jgi:flagellar motor switch protein FliN/FliY
VIDVGTRNTAAARVQPLVADEPDAGAAPPEPVAYEELVPRGAEAPGGPDLALLADVPLDVTVVLGGAVVTIRQLLELGQGSILRLDRHAGEPVDVLVNGTCLARGEVVVIEEDLGVRLTHVVSPEERLRGTGA